MQLMLLTWFIMSDGLTGLSCKKQSGLNGVSEKKRTTKVFPDMFEAKLQKLNWVFAELIVVSSENLETFYFFQLIVSDTTKTKSHIRYIDFQSTTDYLLKWP